MIDFRVKTFLCVCKTMNFTKTAEELAMTQPGVSQHIRFLEDYYNIKLFNYKKKKLELTEQGKYLKNHLETLCHDEIFMKNSLQNLKKKNKIKLGATLSIGEFYIPEKLSKFIKTNPDYELSLTIADTKELLTKLDLGDVDFILCEGYFDKNLYGYELIKNEKMCLVCSSTYDDKEITDLKSIFNHHMLIREKGSGTRDIFETFLRDQNFSLENFVRLSEFTSPHIIKKLLLDNQGISFLYKTVVEEEIKEKKLKEIFIPEVSIVHEFNSIWKKNSIFEENYKSILSRLL